MTKTILLIAPDSGLRCLLSRTLEGRHCRVVEAEDHATARSLALEHSPDLVILDGSSPEKVGIPGTPLIQLTDLDKPRDHEQKPTSQLLFRLTKPFSPLELVRCVELAIGQV